MEKERAEKVAELVSQIKKKQADKKGNQTSKLQQKSTKKSSKMQRIQVGWLHKSLNGAKYKRVQLGEGGGVRHILISKEDDVTVPVLLAKARNVFFPRGTSKFGPLVDMRVKLGDFSQQLLDKFLDIDGNECGFQTYLHSHGLYGNRCYVFLMTTPEAEVEEMVDSSENKLLDVGEMSHGTEAMSDTNQFEKPQDRSTPLSSELKIMSEEFHLYSPYEISGNLACKSLEDAAKNTLAIRYERLIESSYSEVVSRLNCYSRDQCLEAACIENPAILEASEVFEPCDYGYIPVAIEKNGECFVQLVSSSEEDEMEESLKYTYPQTLTSQDISVILHHPTEIWGYDNKQLVVGVVASSHMSEDIYYTWCKDGHPIKEGPSFCCIAVSDPGVYSVQVKTKDGTVTSESVRVGVTTIPVKVASSVNSEGRMTSSSAGSSGSKLQSTDIALPTIPVSDFTFSPEDEIGRGSFGTVYRGKWAGTDVAIKKIKVRKASLIQKSLQSEVYVHSLLRHPNIVQIMAFSTTKNILYIISEYVNGQNLEDIIFGDSNMNITYNTKLFITKQVAQAVAYLQALTPPVVHRDIKPANVLVSAAGFLTKLCDMGISKLKAAQTMCVGTSIGVPGTPSYMAPECFIHREKATVESDIWSLGCTLLELLTEKECWDLGEKEEGNELEGVKKIMERKGKPTTLEQLQNSKVSRGLTEVIVQCFDYNPAGRPKATDIIAAT